MTTVLANHCIKCEEMITIVIVYQDILRCYKLIILGKIVFNSIIYYSSTAT